MDLEQLEQGLILEREAFQQSVNPIKKLAMPGCGELHTMAQLHGTDMLEGSENVWKQQIWSCQDSGCPAAETLSLCKTLCPKPNPVNLVSHTYPQGTNSPIIVNGQDMGRYLTSDRKYEDTLGNQVYAWNLAFEAFRFETKRMHNAYKAFDGDVNVMKIVADGLADSVHIIDCSNPNPEAWTFLYKGWTSDQVLMDPRGKRLIDVLIGVSAEHTLDAYQWVKFTGEPSYARLSRTFKGKRLDYTRAIFLLDDNRLVVITRHEDMSWTQVH